MKEVKERSEDAMLQSITIYADPDGGRENPDIKIICGAPYHVRCTDYSPRRGLLMVQSDQ